MAMTEADRSAGTACDRLEAILGRSQALEPPARADDALRAPRVAFARALLRMRVRPALEADWLEVDPPHAAMFGGTNSGKSTVLNVLLGRPAAGMSYRARFSQHPEVYRPEALGDRFLDAFPSRFAGYRRYHDRHPPRQDDRELHEAGYRPALALNDPAHLEAEALAPPASGGAAFWDIPDFSTEEAATYMGAVLETVALADLVVMAVTNENYADHRGALLRTMVAECGVPLRVVANKIEEGSHLLEDIRLKLGGGIAESASVTADRIHPLPHVRGADDQARLRALIVAPEADALRLAVGADLDAGGSLKRQALRGALDFLDRRLDDLLKPLRDEVDRAEQWGRTVSHLADREFYDRYRRQYLNDEKYVDFNQTLVKLMDLLEIPGVGPYISALSRGLRSVSKAVLGAAVGLFRRAIGRPTAEARRVPEEEVVVEAFDRWYEALKEEVQVRAGRGGHPGWTAVADRLASHDFYVAFAGDLGAAYQNYRDEMDAITAERARALYAVIAKNPALLNTLRGVKVTLDVGSTSLIVASHGLNWTDAVIAPLVAPVQRLILEFGLEKLLDAERSRLKEEQMRAFRQVIDGRMVRPVRDLFHAGARAEDLDQARRDLDAIRSALLGSGAATATSRAATAGGRAR